MVLVTGSWFKIFKWDFAVQDKEEEIRCAVVLKFLLSTFLVTFWDNSIRQSPSFFAHCTSVSICFDWGLYQLTHWVTNSLETDFLMPLMLLIKPTLCKNPSSLSVHHSPSSKSVNQALPPHCTSSLLRYQMWYVITKGDVCIWTDRYVQIILACKAWLCDQQ